MKNTSVFEDDVYSHIEDDVEKIRKKTGMYIPYLGSMGARHLVQELIDNVLDENNNPNSPGEICDIQFDEDENTITVKDNGRGIPFDKLELICTKIQSGSKFEREYGNSAGENGVGLTAVNALSESLTFDIYRQTSDNEYSRGMFQFNEGKLVNKKFKEHLKGNKHGTIITMKPSRMILGECQIDGNELINWLTKLAYIIDYPIRLSVIRNGKTEEYKMKHKSGLIDYINSITDSPLIKPIQISSKNIDTDISNIEIVFTYDINRLDEYTDSFVNRINTIEGGQHVIAAKSAITSILTKYGNESLSLADKKKFEINAADCSSGLVMIVNLSCKYPGFAGQQKEKCGNRSLYNPIRNTVMRLLNRYFDTRPDELKKILNYLKKVAKGRINNVRVRKSDIAGIDSFKSNTMANFSDATEDSSENELYLIEGLSAKGSIMKGRDPRYQAALAFKGVTAGVIGLNPVQVLQNPEYATLVKASGMGIGKEFDISHSKYKRYIISTDADIDGWRISSGMASFFLFQWPEVVKAGMLYVALTPLYMIERDDGSYDYLVSKSALYEEKVNSYVKKAKIRYGNHIYTEEEFRNFLLLNSNYMDILKELYSHEFVHPDIIEFVLSKRNNFKERFPELKYENGIISGSYMNTYQFLMLDKIFYQKSEKMRNIINQNQNIYFDYFNGEKWENDISLGNILVKLQKFDLEIKHRWKGLGSIPPRIFWDIVMNPKKRTLIQLTIEDLDRDIEMMKVLHGSDPKLRRDLLKTYKLNKDDIDS